MHQQHALLWSEVLAFPRLGWHLDPKRSEPFASPVRGLGAGRPHGERLAVGHAAQSHEVTLPSCPACSPHQAGGLCLLPAASLSSQEGLIVGWKGQADPREAELPPPCRGCWGARGWTSVAVGRSGQLSSLDSRGLCLENSDLAAASSIHAFCLTLGNFWIKPWLLSWMLWVSFWR